MKQRTTTKKTVFRLLSLQVKITVMGSSRDWAAKGPKLLGVKAVVVESFERIHRSNLIGMGILPLQFKDGENVQTLNLDGSEIISITGFADDLQPGQMVTMRITRQNGETHTTELLIRIDSPVEVEYYKNGGILDYVIRNFLSSCLSNEHLTRC